MTDTPKSVRDDLHDVLAPLVGTHGAQVSATVPTPGNARSPLVCIDGDGFRFDELDWTWPVRVYIRASDAGVEQAQTLTDDLVAAVDELVGAESWRLSGQTGYLADMDCWIADLRVTIPRVL